MPDSDIDLTAAIGRPPEEVIEFFEAKGYTISWRWRDTWKEAHSKAFTVAGAMKMDVLTTLREAIETDVLEGGQTFDQFRRELEPKLKELGWWGRKEIVNPETGEVEERELGSVRRLRTIYRTNTQTSYNAGRWKNQQASRREFLEYLAVIDASTRPSHRERHRTVLRKDDKWWDANYPPNGWGCRCRTRSLSRRQVDESEVADGEDLGDTASEAFSYNPGKAGFEPDLSEYPDDVAEAFRQAQSDYEPPQDV